MSCRMDRMSLFVLTVLYLLGDLGYFQLIRYGSLILLSIGKFFRTPPRARALPLPYDFNSTALFRGLSPPNC
jgi:hypothetical protein